MEVLGEAGEDFNLLQAFKDRTSPIALQVLSREDILIGPSGPPTPPPSRDHAPSSHPTKPLQLQGA